MSNERLRAYSQFEFDRLIQLDKVYTMGRQVVDGAERINNGGQVILFDISNDRCLIVDTQVAKILSGIGIGLLNECIDLNLEEEVESIRKEKSGW